MKRWVCILIILFNFGVCRAQWEHLFLSRFNPKIIYTRDREEDKPADMSCLSHGCIMEFTQ